MRPEHGGRRRAVDALDGHRFFFLVVVVVLVIAAARRRLGDGVDAARTVVLVPRGDAALLAAQCSMAATRPQRLLYRAAMDKR